MNMAIRTGSSLRWIFPVALAIFLTVALSVISAAQERKNPQTVGVDNTKMGAYRALAQVAYAASQKGDYATAATLAKVLERTWDKGEDYGGDMALSKTNHALFAEIDKAMDQFVTLLIDHPTSAADPARVRPISPAPPQRPPQPNGRQESRHIDRRAGPFPWLRYM